MTKKSYADMDPLEEIRTIKAEISRKFKSLHEYGDYLRKKYPNGATPEQFVRPEDDIALETPTPNPLLQKEEEAYTPPVYHPDMDPLEGIRAIKREIYEKFKTVDAYFKYLEEKYPNGANPEKYIRPEDVDAYFARLDEDEKTEEPAPRPAKRRKTASPAKPRGRGKSAKRLVPA